MKQYADFGFDGRRYVIDPLAQMSLEEPANTNVEALARLLEELNSRSVSAVLAELITQETAGSLAFAPTSTPLGLAWNVDPATASIQNSVELPAVFLLKSPNTIVPVLVLATDGTFVTVIEPGVGKALYRSRAFRSDWTGVILQTAIGSFNGAPT